MTSPLIPWFLTLLLLAACVALLILLGSPARLPCPEYRPRKA